MMLHKVIPDPSDKMILKRALDQLVKDIGGQKFMDVGTWKVIGKRLRGFDQCLSNRQRPQSHTNEKRTTTSPTIP
jgi:hypothetical protein